MWNYRGPIMNQVLKRLGWVLALCAGPAMIWAGVYVDGVDAATIWYGVIVNVIACIAYLVAQLPHELGFPKQFLKFWAFGALLLSLVILPVLAVPILMLIASPVLLPLMVLGTFLSKKIHGLGYAAAPFYVVAFLGGFMAPQLFPASISKSYPPEPPIELADDVLAEKNPTFVDTPDRWQMLPITGRDTPLQIELNKSGAVVALDIAKVKEQHEHAVGQRFSTYDDAARYLQRNGMPWVPSVQMVDQKVKDFSDRAMAAMDLAAQRQLEQLGGGRQAFLEGVLAALLEAGAPEAAAYVAASLLLSGNDPELPDDVATLARKLKERFLDDALASKPVGLYTITEALEAVFQQDRFCQQDIKVILGPEIAFKVAFAVNAALRQNPALAAHYQALLDLQAKITNPPADHHRVLNDYAPGDFASETPPISLFPPSDSKENALFRIAYRGAPDLPQENIMNRFIRAIQSGEADLTPDEDSGWYDYQVYALETLLLPERGQEDERLLLTKEYKERLVEAFRTILTKQRELHVKNVELIPSYGGHFGSRDVIEISPDVTVEPTATYYLRTARALRFVHTAVAAITGEEDFNAIRMDGGESLAEAMRAMAGLLYGLYLQVCDDIGMLPDLLPEELAEYDIDATRETAAEWLAACHEDPVYTGDVRYIVAALTDANQSEVRYWMTTGIRLEAVKAEYAREPKLRMDGKSVEPFETSRPTLRFVPNEFYIPVEEFAEATGPSVPYTREEFRALCDRAGSNEGIIHAVERGRFSGRGLNRATWLLVAGLAVILIAAMWYRQRKERTAV